MIEHGRLCTKDNIGTFKRPRIIIPRDEEDDANSGNVKLLFGLERRYENKNVYSSIKNLYLLTNYSKIILQRINLIINVLMRS